MSRGWLVVSTDGKRQTADLAQSIIHMLQLLLRIQVFLHEECANNAGSAECGIQLTIQGRIVMCTAHILIFM